MTDHVHTGHGPDKTLDCPGCEAAYWEKQKAVEGSGGYAFADRTLQRLDAAESRLGDLGELHEANSHLWESQDELNEISADWNDAVLERFDKQDRIIRIVSIAVLIQCVTMVLFALARHDCDA